METMTVEQARYVIGLVGGLALLSPASRKRVIPKIVEVAGDIWGRKAGHAASQILEELYINNNPEGATEGLASFLKEVDSVSGCFGTHGVSSEAKDVLLNAKLYMRRYEFDLSVLDKIFGVSEQGRENAAQQLAADEAAGEMMGDTSDPQS
jgi:hypothetical protein